jgi:hypothetical protein
MPPARMNLTIKANCMIHPGLFEGQGGGRGRREARKATVYGEEIILCAGPSTHRSC